VPAVAESLRSAGLKAQRYPRCTRNILSVYCGDYNGTGQPSGKKTISNVSKAMYFATHFLCKVKWQYEFYFLTPTNFYILLKLF
jgi:hypothetical protein